MSRMFEVLRRLGDQARTTRCMGPVNSGRLRTPSYRKGAVAWMQGEPTSFVIVSLVLFGSEHYCPADDWKTAQYY